LYFDAILNKHFKEAIVATELLLDDFTDITKHIHLALESINKIFTSGALSEKEKSQLGNLGRTIYHANHDLEHLFMGLQSVSGKLKKDLDDYFHHH
jgi:hypothetical protein